MMLTAWLIICGNTFNCKKNQTGFHTKQLNKKPRNEDEVFVLVLSKRTGVYWLVWRCKQPPMRHLGSQLSSAVVQSSIIRAKNKVQVPVLVNFTAVDLSMNSLMDEGLIIMLCLLRIIFFFRLADN